MPDYFNLGAYTRPVTTSSPLAREWVRRGLLWTYAFNHEEAVACFQQAADADPQCALAQWGLAYALGPNYNKPWEAFEPDEASVAVASAHSAVANAQRHSAGASAAEQALIAALACRYPQARPALDWSVWNQAYADAMRTAYRQQPDDPDVAVLFADALMNLTPWALWNTLTGQPADGAATTEARAVLEGVLAQPAGRLHPGALHLYIHLMEMSPRPEDALWAGELLRELVPDAGHLLHMPTHLDVLCGDYRQVVVSNEAAIRADARLVAARGETAFYTLYRAHNYHFKIYGAMFLGQSELALDTADALAGVITESLLRVSVPPMADWLESFVPMRVHVLIRFGRWQELIDAPLPADPDLYLVTTAMLHYGKGVALAATGQITSAREQRALFQSAAARVPESRTIFNNTCLSILEIAGAMLDGEVAYREGKVEEAFAHLRRAMALDDGLPYDEPWGWMQPTRHAYGALLLEQDRVEEAEAVYRADLGLDRTLPRPCQHPGNVWSLHGYHECLTRLGKTEQAAIIEQQLRVAEARADVPIGASCYCRVSAAGRSASA
jgi:tetratricopeptide (TPR) repeat protein